MLRYIDQERRQGFDYCVPDNPSPKGTQQCDAETLHDGPVADG
jgi:hypothetical protein